MECYFSSVFGPPPSVLGPLTSLLDFYTNAPLLELGLEADRVRVSKHPHNTVTYIVDRNINYTNFCTEYCSFCAFYRPLGHQEGYLL